MARHSASFQPKSSLCTVVDGHVGVGGSDHHRSPQPSKSVSVLAVAFETNGKDDDDRNERRWWKMVRFDLVRSNRVVTGTKAELNG